MSPWRVLRDATLVARFELLRAVRTWRALALALVYVIANLGGAWLFTRALLSVERNVARNLAVAPSSRPGVMIDELRRSEELVEMLGFFAGDPETAARLVDQPLLALFQLWLGLLLLPFLGATTAAEAVADDVGSRAIRFEALRTGRAELALGRFAGQVVLTTGATALALAATWILGMVTMAGQDPAALAAGLASWGARAALIAFPFVGMGMMCSQWTASSTWARVLALGLTAGSWVVYGIVGLAQNAPWTVLADVVTPLLPQTWIAGVWAGGSDLAVSAGACLGLGLGAVGLGFLRFGTRDL